MAGQTDFKHITVNPAEPDDIVIHAGAPKGDMKAPEPVQAQSPSASSAPSSEIPAKARSEASTSYHATTLEDIQGFKMSKTQVAVIILALAAIAAFVVWYLVFS